MTRISRCDFDRTALVACAHPHELKLLVSGEGSHRSLLHPDPEAQQRGQSALACSSSCGCPPLPRPTRLLGATLFDSRGAIPQPLGCRREAAAALLCLPKVADVTAS
eukprot:scaffold103177_cov33-Phaeocystis_antarctica.AAC.2